MLKVEESSGGRGAWAPTLCESCRSAPCTVYCRADAAALCAACDANIHSANLLARRHHRVPILPALAGGGAAGLVVRPSLNLPYHIGVPVDGAERGGVGVGVGEEEDHEEDDDEDAAAASWMLLNPLKGNSIQSCHSLLFGDEGDEFLDLEDYNNNNNSSNNNTSSENQSAEDYDGRKDQDAQRSHGGRSDVGSEFVVPNEQHSQQHQQGYHMMDQFEGSHAFGYSPSLNHSASFSSMDASLVPDATCMADISNADQYVRPSKGTIDLFSGHPFLQVPSCQFNPMDREARVLRYREKRKNRKFEKTIRYASRKAYAETRPRIKGRFAKRSDLEVEVDQMFSTSVLADSTYGIVPSF